MAYSIGARSNEPKTRYIEGSLEPATDQAIEIRVNEALLADKVAFRALIKRMMQRMRERGQPRF